MNDFKIDRFGWVKTARKYFSCASDAELFLDLTGYAKESTGEAWIDEKNDVLVLGPASGQTPENFDNFFFDRVLWYLGTFPKWNKTQYWIDIESGLKDNPFRTRGVFSRMHRNRQSVTPWRKPIDKFLSCFAALRENIFLSDSSRLTGFLSFIIFTLMKNPTKWFRR